MGMQTQESQNSPARKTPLNDAQNAAVLADFGPLLIVAGAGTGKTRTLIERLKHLIAQGIRPERICAITFTNKAAKEMARRIGREGPFLGTFHALGARILRKESGALGRGPNFAIFDDHDSFDLVKKATKSVIPPHKRGEEAIGAAAKKAQKETPMYFGNKISAIKNLGVSVLDKDDRAGAEKKAQIMRVFEIYESLLEKNNAFDFDDLIQKVVHLFKTRPDILAKYQNMFDAILVDEYQDINPMQYELVALLAGRHRNLSVVGDDEQTIYSWRYADIMTFLNFDKQWEGAAVYFLEENYRSTGTIIKAAATVVGHNRLRTPKTLWTRNPAGEPIQLFEAWGENDEAEWVAGKIKEIRNGNKQADIAILYRTNAQSRAVEQALIRNAIPYRIFGGLKFYERKEVKDVVAALRYIANRKDEVAKERLEKGLTKRRFAEFKERIAMGDMYADDRGPVVPIMAIKLFLESFNYFDYLETNFMNANEREENIAELIAFASEFQDLHEMLERLSLLQAVDDIGAKPQEGKEVSLMTIHLAKGLEFDNVFIVGAAEGFLPHGRSMESESALEEERRLMYVAMTRARKRLFISFYGIPSRFIAEIPEDCIIIVNSSGEGGSKNYSNEGPGEENIIMWD